MRKVIKHILKGVTPPLLCLSMVVTGFAETEDIPFGSGTFIPPYTPNTTKAVEKIEGGYRLPYDSTWNWPDSAVYKVVDGSEWMYIYRPCEVSYITGGYAGGTVDATITYYYKYFFTEDLSNWDTTPPTLTLKKSTDAWTQNLTVTAAAKDTGSGVKNIKYKVS